MNHASRERLAFSLLVFVSFSPSLEAANLLWDGTGTSWNNAASWSLFSNATTPNPAAKPGASDTAIFNIETVNTAQTVNLNAAQAAQGLFFSSTGPVTIQTGTGTNTLSLGSGGVTVSAGAGVTSLTSAVSLSASQTWTNDAANPLTVSGSVAQGNNALTIAGSRDTTISGTLSGSGVLAKSGAGRLTLAGLNTFTGVLAISSGEVSLDEPAALSLAAAVAFTAGSTGVLSLAGRSANVDGLMTDAFVGTPVVQNGHNTRGSTLYINAADDMTFGGELRDGGSQPLGLSKSGAGTLTLSGSLAYTGRTSVEGGAVILAGPDNPLGPFVGVSLDVFGPASFELNGRSVAATQVYLAGDGPSGGFKQSAPGNSTLTVPFSTVNENAFNLNYANGGGIHVTHSGGRLTLDARLYGPGTLYKFGAGTLLLARASDSGFSGNAVVEEGTLAIGHDLALGGATVSLLGGALRADGGTRVVANAVTIGSLGATFTGGDDLTLTGVVGGTGHLTKLGSGKLTLNDANIHSGGATVEEGVLEVNGPLQGNIVVRDGGSLQGTGAIGGGITVDSGGELTPGSGPVTGTLSVGSLSLGVGATTHFELAGPTLGSSYDHLEVAGDFAFGGLLSVSLAPGFTPSLGQLFDLMNWGTRIGLFTDVSLPALAGGLEWDTSLLYSAGALSVVSAGLPGDYDNNGKADAADYTIWRDGSPLLNETASIGVVDAADYAAWSANYGATATASLIAVPEPTAALLAIAGLAGVASGRRP